MDPSVGQTISHYRILSRLGGGRWGVVFKAEDGLLERTVALRFLPATTDRDALELFETQAKAVSALHHPHIAEMYEIGEWEGQPFIVRELLEGESLRKRMNRRPLSLPEILDVGAQMADALEAAHGAGFFHGDLRPENMFLNRRGEIKVQDFGLARLTPGTTSISSGIGPQGATAAYFSPEQQRGDPIYARSDIFSLGAVLYELAAGRPAFACQTAEECGKAVMSKMPAPASQFNPEVPVRYDEIVNKALEKDLELRYQTAVELRTDLRRLRRDWEADRIAVTRAALVEPGVVKAGASEAAAAAGAIAARPEPGAKRRWMWIAAGLLLAGAVGAVTVRLLHQREPQLPTVFRRLTFRRGLISSARISPDGKEAYYTADWNGAAPDIYSVRPATQQSQPLVGGQSAILSVSSKGELAVLRQPTIYQDGRIVGNLVEVAKGGGTPQPILSGIEGADWAPDGRKLVVVRRVGGMDRLEYPAGMVLRETTGWIQNPRFSPKGNEIAYVMHPVLGDERGSVEVVDLAGKPKTLSSDWRRVNGLAWSPKGDEIWFTATRSTAPQLYGVSLEGKPRQVGAIAGSLRLADVGADGKVLMIRDDEQTGMLAVSAGPAEPRDISWVDRAVVRGVTADGKGVLVEVGEGGEGGGNDAIYLRATDGSKTIRLGEGNALAISPDGKSVLVEEPGTENQLALLPIGGGDVVRMPPSAVTPIWGAWLPDGKRFVILGRTPGHGRQLFVEDRDGGGVRAFSPEGVGGSAAVSPDGRRVVAVGPDGKGHFYPVDGGVVPTIPGLVSADLLVGWSQDGQGLYVADGSVPIALYRLNLGTGTRRLLWQLAPSDRAGVTGLTGISVTPDGRVCVYSYSRTLSTLYLAEGLQ